jgi:histone H3/H4
MSVPTHSTSFDDEYGLTWGLKGNDDLSLPKATVQKIINEILAHDPGLPFARETRDLLIECCVEFITLISSEANEIAEKDAKKTIACEHVTTALEQLGYPDYVPEIVKVAQEHKTQQVVHIPPPYITT